MKDSLNEYYKVGSLENYDEVYRAVAFFAFKYARTGEKRNVSHPLEPDQS